jgi:hypothetical protein
VPKKLATGGLATGGCDARAARGASPEFVGIGKTVTAYGYPSVDKDEMRAERITRRGQDCREAMTLQDAPRLLIALEQSDLGAAIRQSAWAYPAANVGHILALSLFAASIALMDVRLLGAFAAAPQQLWSVRRAARRCWGSCCC